MGLEALEDAMRRPLMYISSAFGLGIILAHYFKPFIWLSIYFVLLFLISFKEIPTLSPTKYRNIYFRQRKFLLILVLTSLLGSLNLGFAHSNLELPKESEGQVVSLRGRVTAQEEGRDSLILTVKASSLGKNFKVLGQPAEVKYLVYVKGGQGKDYLGDVVSLRGKLQIPDKRRNPGLFDYSLHLKTRAISASISVFETNVAQENKINPLIKIPGQIKRKILQDQTLFMSGESAGLLRGILFGDKKAIEEDIYESFQKNGTAHILAVSGIHVSIIYAYVAGLFSNKRSKKAGLFIILFLVFYCALAEFSPSVIRAVSMIVIHLLGKLIHRRYDFPSAIAGSALLMLVVNPYSLFNIGFQMSYLAVLALAFALPHFKGYTSPLGPSLVPLLAVQTGLAPLTAFHFMYFSFSAFLINIPVIFLAGLAVPLGVGLGLLSLLPAWPIVAILQTGGYLILEKTVNLMIWMNKLATASGLSHMNVRAPSLVFLALFYGFFFFFLSESFLILMQKKQRKAIKLVCLGILALAMILPLSVSDLPGKADLVFVDVGQGDCLHIRTAEGKNILIDGGGQRDFDVGKRILKPYLLKNGVNKIDLALVTHLHHDHYDGIASLCKELPVDKLGVYEGNLLKIEGLKTDTGLKEENFLFLVAGDTIKIGKETEIQVIYPKRRTLNEYEYLMGENEDENLNSLVFMVKHKKLSAMITGDLTEYGEIQLMSLGENLKTDILKVGHHGSRFSTTNNFLQAASPQIAVIQVGRNNYGHPHGQVIEKLEKKGIMVYRNDTHGAVLIKINKKGFKVRTML